MQITTPPRRRSATSAAGVLLLPFLLGGCHLLDQTSFGRGPQPPAADQLTQALASHGATPLLVIYPDDGVPFTDALNAAVGAAEARNGNVRFRVESVVPEHGSLIEQQTAIDQAGVTAQEMLSAMEDVGISPDRVTLGGRTEKGLLRREIRLYES